MWLRLHSEMVLFYRRQIGVIVEAVRNLFLIEGRKQESKNQALGKDCSRRQEGETKITPKQKTNLRCSGELR